ncbi:MAG: homocysteine S-methyltransferase family protein [Anaerolineae bacterium]
MGFVERLAQGDILVADGATGTWLQAEGLRPGTPPELWNVERPEAILRMHQAYLEAGAQVILTNTFGGSRHKLAKAGLGDRMEELVGAAVRLARQAAGGDALVAGDIGPLGDLLAPLGKVTYEEAVAIFAEQVRVLAEGGADLILVETMSDLQEAAAAIEGARSATDLPIVCSMSFDTHGRTMMGVTPQQMVQRLWPMGLAAIGVNCGRSLADNAAALRAAHTAAPEAPLWYKPNAGLPRLEGGRTVFDVGPEEFAAGVVAALRDGARIVGGCCGTTPAHIRALVEALGREGA